MPLRFLYLLLLELSDLMIISVLLSIIQNHDVKKLYKEFHKLSFPFEHGWHELRDQPKWREDYSMKKQKPKKSGDT